LALAKRRWTLVLLRIKGQIDVLGHRAGIGADHSVVDWRNILECLALSGDHRFATDIVVLGPDRDLFGRDLFGNVGEYLVDICASLKC